VGNIIKALEKNIVDVLEYKDKGLEEVVKTVFETILKLERSEFLESNNNHENKANGFYPRMLKAINNYFRLSIPRDRLGLFKPAFLDILRGEEAKRQELAFKLYVKGLSTREIESIFKDVFSSNYSPASISKLNKRFQQERDAWLNKPINEDYYFIFIDALQVAVRRDVVTKEVFYIVVGLNKSLKREILGVYNIPVESSEGWREVFKDLKSRGLSKVILIVADGLSGLEVVVREELPGAKLQKCLVHKIRHILLKARSRDKAELAADFRKVFELENPLFKQKKGELLLEDFIIKWQKIYPWIKNRFKMEHYPNYFAYTHFPAKIQRMIYTTNWIERLNRNIRRTEKNRLSFPNPDSALNLICANLMDFEERVYKYPITSFKPVVGQLDDLFLGLSRTQEN
jgi:transposase-like protein